MTIVAKFGGTSVATAAKLHKVYKFVRSEADRRYIVVSAAGKRHAGDEKVTDLLRECIRRRDCNMPYHASLRKVFDRHSMIVRDLGLELDLEPDYANIHQAAEHGASGDHIESRGEYLMGRIVSRMLHMPLVDPTQFVTFGENGFMDSLTYERTAKVLSGFQSAVVPGYYGGMLDDQSRVKVFSRGGSDISGAIVARGVRATRYENCTDVYGVYAADPRIVEDPVTIRSMTHSETRELAYMGASVIHPDALFPVLEAQIPIRVLNTDDPDYRYTDILSEVDHRTGSAVGIAGRKGFTVITVKHRLMNPEIGFAWRVLGVLKDLGISFDHMPGGFDSISIVIEDRHLDGNVPKLVEAINAIYPKAEVCYIRDLAMIAVVGEGMVRASGTAAKIFASLAAQQINVPIIDQGASEMTIVIGVESEDFEAAIRAIYRDCVEK